jgi:hypothetical protein
MLYAVLFRNCVDYCEGDCSEWILYRELHPVRLWPVACCCCLLLSVAVASCGLLPALLPAL